MPLRLACSPERLSVARGSVKFKFASPCLGYGRGSGAARTQAFQASHGEAGSVGYFIQLGCFFIFLLRFVYIVL
jgi:hypothetical protein